MAIILRTKQDKAEVFDGEKCHQSVGHNTHACNTLDGLTLTD